eukprot:TRINITY_DN11136_c0_g1_i1.p1 TRINITY_DN11136_c0_g1~~TRINITY_DN11136_c0_g1_i1.p1  ORF type:complete len:256 (+),score=67.73 TRINITY_DN11136_c0_g1_i1:64-768(+)
MAGRALLLLPLCWLTAAQDRPQRTYTCAQLLKGDWSVYWSPGSEDPDDRHDGARFSTTLRVSAGEGEEGEEEEEGTTLVGALTEADAQEPAAAQSGSIRVVAAGEDCKLSLPAVGGRAALTLPFRFRTTSDAGDYESGTSADGVTAHALIGRKTGFAVTVVRSEGQEVWVGRRPDAGTQFWFLQADSLSIFFMVGYLAYRFYRARLDGQQAAEKGEKKKPAPPKPAQKRGPRRR